MKDIYELLNDVNVDDKEFEEMEVTEFEKAKVKRTLKKSMINKKKRMGWKKNIAAAAMVVGLSTAALGLAFPAYAGNIPVIGDIFKFLDNDRTGMYDSYKEFSTELNLTQESNGIKMTINDAVYDGKTVAITYSIESERDLGELVKLNDMATIRKGNYGMGGRSQISKIDDTHYVGLDEVTFFDLTSDTIDIKWNVDRFFLHDTDEEVKGKWDFVFSLKATDNQVLLSNESAEQNGVRVSVEKVTFTPMSFIVYYDQLLSEQAKRKWNNVDVGIEVRDDLGNVYAGDGAGGSGQGDYAMNWSETFGKLDPNATKLIITPTVNLSNIDYGDGGGEELLKENGDTETAAIKTKATVVGETSTSTATVEESVMATDEFVMETEEFVMEDIIIELKK